LDIDRDKIAEKIREIKQFIDEVMPLESSFIKDQFFLMFISSIFPKEPFAETWQEKLEKLSAQTEKYRHEFMATYLTGIAAEKGEEWTWTTFRQFLRNLKELS